MKLSLTQGETLTQLILMLWVRGAAAWDRLSGQRQVEGVALADVLHFANLCKAHNKIIVLDSCHSGIAGNAHGQAICGWP